LKFSYLLIIQSLPFAKIKLGFNFVFAKIKVQLNFGKNHRPPSFLFGIIMSRILVKDEVKLYDI